MRKKCGKGSLKTLWPELAAEWDYEKNGKLTPQDVPEHSHKKVWWKCEKGHSWQATADNRVRGSGCPYCNHKLPIVGETDLATVRPELAAEWDYEKNGDLTPQDVTEHSGKKVWWKCNKGHSWQTRIANRANGSGCLYCNHKLPIVGETDLATVRPELAAEWDYEKNGKLTPQDVPEHSHKKVWWKCEKGHSWQATVDNRAKGSGCPYCNHKLPIVGETDLATVRPELAAEWDYEKNGKLTPQDVTEHSSKKVWWKCEKGHSWQATVDNRAKGKKCPYCNHKLPIVGETDLATVRPELAAEWDYEKNGDHTPQDFTEFSNKKVWWKCSKGHSWPATINHRANGTECPYCNHKLPIVGETDLATVRTDLTAEWDFEKNKDLTPQDVTEHSGKKVWWKCKEGHSWQATVDSRATGSGCPYDSGYKRA